MSTPKFNKFISIFVFYIILNLKLFVQEIAYSNDLGQLLGIHLNYCLGIHNNDFNANLGEFVIPLFSQLGFPCIDNYKTFEFILFQCVALTLILVLFIQRNNLFTIVYALIILLFLDLFVVVHLFRQIVASYLCLSFVFLKHSKLIKGVVLVMACGLHLSTGIIFCLFYICYSIRVKYLLLFLTLFFSLIILNYEYIEFFVIRRYGFAFESNIQSDSLSYINAMYKYFALSIVMCLWGSKRLNRLIMLAVFMFLLIIFGGSAFIGADAIFRVVVYFRYILFPLLLSYKVVELISLSLKSSASSGTLKCESTA